MVAGFSLYVIRMMETVERQNVQLAVLKAELDRKEEIISLLAADGIDIVVMSGVQVNTPARARIICSPVHRTALVHVSHLPVLPGELEYGLWAVRAADTVSVVRFSVQDTTDSWFKITDFPFDVSRDITAFAVTVEPKHGSTARSGAVFLSGPVQR